MGWVYVQRQLFPLIRKDVPNCECVLFSLVLKLDGVRIVFGA